jgi:hypothetical protein
MALQEPVENRERMKLKETVAEASRALARLDAGRLEELALSCQALNRDLAEADKKTHQRLAVEFREAESEMAVFARVLDATRANLQVMNRLRELREGRLEYRGASLESGGPQAPEWRRIGCGQGSGHGDN